MTGGNRVSSKNAATSSLVISYLTLRKAVGLIGVSLPFVLVVGKWLTQGWGIQSSMSAYYYTSMRDVFVGSLCAIGVFLLSYRGYDDTDNLMGNLTCAFAVGIAIFPTSPGAGASATQTVIGYVHLACAIAYFLTLAYYSLVLFTKTNTPKHMTRRKKQRNVVYVWCGYIIVACVALILVYFLFLKNTGLAALDPVFWLESTAVLAFGVSWLTKGEAILADTRG